MSAVEPAKFTAEQWRAVIKLVLLVALLALVVGVGIGYRWMTVAQIADQAMQGLFALTYGAAASVWAVMRR